MSGIAGALMCVHADALFTCAMSTRGMTNRCHACRYCAVYEPPCSLGSRCAHAGACGAERDEPEPLDVDPALTGWRSTSQITDRSRADDPEPRQRGRVAAVDRWLGPARSTISPRSGRRARADALRAGRRTGRDAPAPAARKLARMPCRPTPRSAPRPAPPCARRPGDCAARRSIPLPGRRGCPAPSRSIRAARCRKLPAPKRRLLAARRQLPHPGAGRRGDGFLLHSRAPRPAFRAQHVARGRDDVLRRRQGHGDAYVVYARKLPNGATEVDLVTSGAEPLSALAQAHADAGARLLHFVLKRPDRRSSRRHRRRSGGDCPTGRPRRTAPPSWRRWSAGSS